jgi:hypothetical protein
MVIFLLPSLRAGAQGKRSTYESAPSGTRDLRINAKCIDQFANWQRANEALNLEDLVDYAVVLSAFLVAYIQFLRNSSCSITWGAETLAGIQWRWPRLRGQLRPPWAIQKQWRNIQSYELRVPLPLAVLLAVRTADSAQGCYRFAVALVLEFRCFLRPVEIGVARRVELLLPRDTGDSRLGVVAVQAAKTAERGAKLQSVLMEDPYVISLVNRTFGQDLPTVARARWSRGVQLEVCSMRETPWHNPEPLHRSFHSR